MALVRICQLGELEDLAAVIAELRGGSVEPPPSGAAPRQTATATGAATSKKNAEPQRLATVQSASPTRRIDSPHGDQEPVTSIKAERSKPSDDVHPSLVDDNVASVAKRDDEQTAPPAVESVLERFQRAMAGKGQPAAVPASPPRPSLREQKGVIAEQPFVKKAMELFGVEPGQLRYTPPEGDSN
jgi:hypothetical protein